MIFDYGWVENVVFSIGMVGAENWPGKWGVQNSKVKIAQKAE
jgi:hypothetical protein